MAQTWQGHAPDAFETPMARIGRRGLNLVDAIDDLDLQELSRCVNLVSRFGGPLEVRPAQTALATTSAGQHVHSVSRLNDPTASAFTLLAGSNTDVYRGASGAMSLVDSDYSGDPLCFAEATAATTGTAYTFIGDRTKIRKVARTGVVAIIGVPAQTNAPSVAVAAENTTSICRFDSQDSTQAGNWTLTAGADTEGTASGTPTAAAAGDAVSFALVPGSVGTGLGYYSLVSIAKVIDLSVLQAGLYVATDDDLINLRLRVDRPDWLEEIRVFFVCSLQFTTGVIPGTSPVSNPDAFWKAFRPSDLASYLDLLGQPDAESVAKLGDNLRQRRLREEFKTQRDSDDDRRTAVNRRAATELYRTEIAELIAGRSVETVTGVVGFPLRRGDFARIGADSTRGWANITGIVIVLRANTNEALSVICDDWRLTGGGGPDTTPATYQPYDFRVTDFDPATGVEGNPSPIMAEALWIDALRQPLRVSPARGSNIATTWRQKFYRRGGSPTTSNNWYYDGQNSSDGGTYETYRTDAEVQVEPTLQIDQYQPVPSVNSSGATVLAQAVPIFFRVEDYMFALGDPNQPQRLYRSKRQKFDAWSATEYKDVCAASEELLNGCEWGGGGFVFSRNRMYAVLLNAIEGTWTTEPTGCREGLGGRWAMCPTPYGIAFVNSYGAWLTQGSAPVSLSAEQIGPLFKSEAVRGLNPIDFTVPTALKLAYHDHELWVTYQDQTAGARRQIIYNFFDKTWRAYLFGETVSVVYSEPVQGAAARLLLGGRSTGQVYTHDGFSDDGAAIAYTARSGAVDFGDPAIEKLLTQVVVDAEIFTSTLTVQPFINDELTSLASQARVGTAGLRRYIFEDAFGTVPQRARNIAVELSGNAPTGSRPFFNIVGIGRHLEPQSVINEPTPWEELPGGEGYLYGCILTCDTTNVARSVEVEYTTVNGAVTSASTLSVQANGRRKLLFTWTAVLAHQVRLRPTGTDEWLRYKIEWLADPEPPRLSGWNTNWDPFGSYADKWLKGFLIECDTLNVAKTVVIDIDQSLAVVSQAVTQNGRGIQQFSFAKQRGKLFRLRATDANAGKLYRWQPIFDEEPLALTRWESQETDHGRHGWQKPIEAWITLRSSAVVTLQVISYGEDGTALATKSYTIASTAGAKMKRRVTFDATKGVLFNYLFTASAVFWLYREESHLLVEDWTKGETFDALLPPATDDLMVPPRQVGTSGASEKPLHGTV